MKSSPLPSLWGRLFLWLMLPLGVFTGFDIYAAHREAQHTATLVQDRLLLGSARIIAQQIQFEDGLLEVAIPPAALELFQSADQDQVYYRIASPSGLLLSGYAELPGPPGPLKAEESHAFSSRVRGRAVRVVAYAQPVFAAPEQGPVIIEVAQTFAGHQRMVQQIWVTSLRQNFWILVLAAVMISLALRRGLKGVVALREAVLARDPGSLDPMDPTLVPRELQPLVVALNDYVKRLDKQMAVRSRFIANAAHQLRTPFTVLQTQVNFGLRHGDPEEKDEALRAIFAGVRNGTRLVNQLLSLSTAEAGPSQTLPAVPVKLRGLAQQVLEEQAALAQARDIDLGLDLQDKGLVVLGSQAMLHELVANLVDNALRYTPPKGMVTVLLDRHEGRPRLRVEDNGPGIPAADRGRVFERFCRLHEGEIPGCGLGLAIAKEICQSLGAEIRLSDPETGTGLVVTLLFPAGPAAPEPTAPA
jgi:two-component system sensor histidine kinase TctE